MTAAYRSGVVAERRAAYARLRAQGASSDLAAELLHVTPRTADRYEAWLRSVQGLPAAHRPAGWMWGPILGHLHTYPHLELSALELGRVLGGAPSVARRTLLAMVEAGLVEQTVRPTSARCARPVHRYRLAVREEARAA